MSILNKQIFVASNARHKKRLTRHLSINILGRIWRLIAILIVLVVVNSLAMMGYESMKFSDAVWMSLTTVATVGYGDISPSTIMGRAITVLCLYVFAISVMTILISEVVEWRIRVNDKKRKGFWEWNEMKDHIQIINCPNQDTERYLIRLLTEIHKTESLNELSTQLLTRKFPEGISQALMDLHLIHRTGVAEDPDSLETLGLEKAKYIIILARDVAESVSDSVTFDILSRIKKINTKARVIAEVVIDDNQTRFLEAGADVVVRPIRAYPEMIVRSMVSPGAERVIEGLLGADGDTLQRIDLEFGNLTWLEIVSRTLKNGLGTPVAFLKSGALCIQPDADDVCEGDALIVIAQDNLSLCEADFGSILDTAVV